MAALHQVIGDRTEFVIGIHTRAIHPAIEEILQCTHQNSFVQRRVAASRRAHGAGFGGGNSARRFGELFDKMQQRLHALIDRCRSNIDQRGRVVTAGNDSTRPWAEIMFQRETGSSIKSFQPSHRQYLSVHSRAAAQGTHAEKPQQPREEEDSPPRHGGNRGLGGRDGHATRQTEPERRVPGEKVGGTTVN